MDCVFDFKDSDSWLIDIQNFFEKHNVLVDSFEFEDKIKEVIKQYVIKRFTHIVYYHGTATDNISSYLQNGILPSSVQNRIEYARQLLSRQEFPQITDELFNQKKNEYLQDTRYILLNEGKIYFVLDADILTEEGSTYYLCYGGEHLASFVNSLGGTYMYELRKKLKPVIFKCKVPINLLEKDDAISTLVDDIIAFYQCEDFFVSSSAPYIMSKIEPECILGYEYIESIQCD